MNTKKIFWTVLFLFVKIVGYGQSDPGLKLLTSAAGFKVQERVVLMTDQDLYLAGEPLHFMALTFDAGLKIPVVFSSVLYVEFYNQDFSVIDAKKFLLKNGEGIYSLTLPRQLETGYYYIRAYTNYMKNFGPAAFFTKRLKVVNPFYKTHYSDDANPGELKLDVRAEGGKIIAGIENKVGFHTPGFNKRVLARIYKDYTVIAETEAKNGFGVLTFTPDASSRYRLEAVAANKPKATVELNNIVSSGVICKLDSVKNTKACIKVVVRDFDRFPLSVFIENNGIHYLYDHPVNSEASLKIELPAGFNRIIFKDNRQEEVSERLVYIKPKPGFEIKVNPEKQKALPGDTIVLHLSSGNPDTIHYMVALNLGNSSTAPSLNELMESSVFASSIASGSVSSNDLEYLCSNPKNINDYLLNFRPSPIPSKITYAPEIENDLITGSITEKAGASKNIYLSFVDSISWIYRSKTDSLGRFTAALPLNFQGNNLTITVNDTTQNYTIKTDEEFYPEFIPVIRENYYPDSTLKKVIESRMLNLQVQDAYSGLSKSISSRPSLRFYGSPDAEYNFRKYVNLPFLEEFMFEIVKEANVTKKDKQVRFRVLDKSRSIIGDHPLFLLDGVPLFSTGNLAYIRTEKLESVRVVSSKFFFGSNVYDGVIDITSNTKSFDLIDVEKNAANIPFHPVITPKEISNPDDPHIPLYISDIYFHKVSSTSNRIQVRLPQNTGTYSLSVFGYTQSGEWGILKVMDAVRITN